MKKTFIISGRQTGKTQTAISEFLKNPDESLFMCFNDRHKSKIFNDKKYKHHCISQNINVNEYTRGKKFKKIIIDDYLWFVFGRQIKIYNDINTLINVRYGIEELFIISSPNNIINNFVFHTLKNTKQYYYSYNKFIYDLNKFAHYNTDISIDAEYFFKKIIDDKNYNYLYNNFLTDIDINIIKSVNTNIELQRMLPLNPEVFGEYLNNNSIHKEINNKIIRELIRPLNKKYNEIN